MKAIQIFSVAVVLVLAGTALATLTVHDYIPNQKVVHDDQTGDYWYWKLADFTYKTYDQQITMISQLGNYGDIAGGWHMAVHSEIVALFSHEPSEITAAFASIRTFPDGTELWSGREDHEAWVSGAHYIVELTRLNGVTTPLALDYIFAADDDEYSSTGAWVTTSAPRVPAPPELALVAPGLVYVLRIRRRFRKS